MSSGVMINTCTTLQLKCEHCASPVSFLIVGHFFLHYSRYIPVTVHDCLWFTFHMDVHGCGFMYQWYISPMECFRGLLVYSISAAQAMSTTREPFFGNVWPQNTSFTANSNSCVGDKWLDLVHIPKQKPGQLTPANNSSYLLLTQKRTQRCYHSVSI